MPKLDLKQGLYLSVLLLFSLGACRKTEPDNDNPNPNLNDSIAIAADTLGLEQNTSVQDAQGHRYLIGFDQVSSINQNPYIEKRNAQDQVLWRQIYEQTPVDGRGLYLYLDGQQRIWAVFSVDGGSNDAGYINRLAVESGAFSNVWAGGYGSGGGPKVSVLAQINPEDGKIIKGSFLYARLSDGRTNTLNVQKIGFKNNRLAVFATSAAWPTGRGNRYERMPNISDADRQNGAFQLYYELETDFSSITTAKIFKP